MATVHGSPHDANGLCGEPATKSVSAKAISDRAEGEAYVASVCFKHGPPRLVGAELEYTVHHIDDPGRRLDPAHLASVLGNHVPTTLVKDSPSEPLPSGSPLSLEPGAQVEISLLPQPSLAKLIASATDDLGYLTELLRRGGLRLGRHGIDPYRPARRILRTERYAAMERRFAPMGPDGITMMCSTAAVQVCLDCGDEATSALRWAAAHAAGPTLLALFANSRHYAGKPTGRASARWFAVSGTEQARTRPERDYSEPGQRWAERVLDTPLMVLPRPGPRWDAPPNLTFAEWIEGRGAAARLKPPTTADLDYHLTTMFTPVRPRGYLEVRYLDTQPVEQWASPVALLTALFAQPSTVDSLLDVCAPAANQWDRAAERGLADPVLAGAARGVADLGCAALSGTGLAESAITEIADDVQQRVHAAGKETP